LKRKFWIVYFKCPPEIPFLFWWNKQLWLNIVVNTWVNFQHAICTTYIRDCLQNSRINRLCSIKFICTRVTAYNSRQLIWFTVKTIFILDIFIWSFLLDHRVAFVHMYIDAFDAPL
jgi:hypothetical protein